MCSCTAFPSHSWSSVHLCTAITARLFYEQTVENKQFVYELARRNLKERVDKQTVANETLSFSSFKPGELVLIHRQFPEADGYYTHHN